MPLNPDEAAPPSPSCSRLDKSFWLRHALWPALLLCGVVLLSEFTGLEMWLLDRLFDFGARHWRYGDSWWANTLIHDWGRNLIALIFLASALLWLASFLFAKFSLLALYFLWRDRRPRRARRALLLVLGLGLVYAWGQWVRGAHFPSHDLWSAAIGWYVSLLLYVVYFRNKFIKPKESACPP